MPVAASSLKTFCASCVFAPSFIESTVFIILKKLGSDIEFQNLFLLRPLNVVIFDSISIILLLIKLCILI